MNPATLSFVDRILCSLKAAMSSGKYTDNEIAAAIVKDPLSILEIPLAYSKLFPEHGRNVRPDSMTGQIKSMLDGLRQLAQSGRRVLFLMEWNQKLIPVESDNVSGPQSDASTSTLNLLNERLDKMEENQNKFMRTMQENFERLSSASSTVRDDSWPLPGAPPCSTPRITTGSAEGMMRKSTTTSPSSPSNTTTSSNTTSFAAAAARRTGSRGQRHPVVSGSRKDDSTRKMRSAPADIFIYNVNPKCTVENIVDDLKASNICVAKSDVIRMSKSAPADSRPLLDSYRITLQAEDFQKALHAT